MKKTPVPKPGDTEAARAIQEKTAAEKQQLKDRVTNAAIQEQQAVLEQWKKEAAEKKKAEAAEQEKRRQANTDAIIYRGCATLGLASPQQCDTEVGIFSSSALVIKAHFLNFDPYNACKNTAWELRTKLLQGRSLWKKSLGETVDGDSYSKAVPVDPLKQAVRRYESPSRFTATVLDEDGKPMVFVFKRNGLRWKLADIRLPV